MRCWSNKKYACALHLFEEMMSLINFKFCTKNKFQFKSFLYQCNFASVLFGCSCNPRKEVGIRRQHGERSWMFVQRHETPARWRFRRRRNHLITAYAATPTPLLFYASLSLSLSLSLSFSLYLCFFFSLSRVKLLLNCAICRGRSHIHRHACRASHHASSIPQHWQGLLLLLPSSTSVAEFDIISCICCPSLCLFVL